MSDRHFLQTVSINKLFLSPFDDKCFILEGSLKTLPFAHADAIEATDLETDPELDATTHDEIEDLCAEEWETDNESDSTLLASTGSWQPPDPSFNRIINKSDLNSEDNVDFEVVIEKQSSINCPFIDYEAVEFEDGSNITDSEEEEAIPPRKRGHRT